ncbi:oligosaccharide flippase family protein [Sphingomonas sp. Leaf343]|uniref:oligosaccharide flippase family protein n=1 Tax=Sphingomonas sp. Leaf343 TaxID=1736345 RepID=UPI0006F5E0F9|nr:oligosaccharide flippase family protein [Sphingomonas sp. Leaf343]KQR88065.1 hypothetical protein ASG07_04290 [Sphingomonas sp. Leaf343]
MTDDGPARSRKGTKIYMAGVGVAQVCALLRYTLLARLLGPEQLGLAVTLILTAQFFDSVSDSGSDRFLVQDEHGDDPRAQSLVQLLSVARGFAIAGALLVFAGPIAWFYNEPGLTVGLMWLGLAPLIGGFLHFDVRRSQRHHDFRREGASMMIAEVASLGAMIAAALWTQSYVAALAGLTVRSLALVLVSQSMAERRYRLGYSRELAPRLALFALPLMLNGLVLFLSGQGDRLLVGSQLGIVELGRYSAVMLLIYFPSATLMKYLHTMQMPIIVRARASRATLEEAIDTMAGEALLVSLAMLAGFAIIAPVAAPFLFGARFAQPPVIIALIGVLQVARFIRIWPTTSALALGNSRVVLAGNLIRMMTYPAAFAGLWTIGGLEGLTLGIAVAELAGIAIIVAMTNKALGMRTGVDAGRVLMLVLASVAVTGSAWMMQRYPGMAAWSSCALTAMVFGVLAWRERKVVFRLYETVAMWRMASAKGAGR